MELMKYEHCIVGANLHLQFTPTYRRDIFCDFVVISTCRDILYEVAKTLDFDIVACAFGLGIFHFSGALGKNTYIPQA